MIGVKKNTRSLLSLFFKLFGKKIYVYPSEYDPRAEKQQYLKSKMPAYVTVINEGYGHAKSVELRQSIDNEGNPLPWFTYPAIEYIKQLDLKDKIVLEWGSGNSSRFFSALARQVYSIEHNYEWFEKVKNFKLPNQFILYAAQEVYADTVLKFNTSFDIIVIDGIEREKCAAIAPKYLKEGGIIIFDNSDRHPAVCASLRQNDFIQVDMHGLGPINDYTWTTSFFFSRNFKFAPKGDLQPVIPIGGGY